MEVSKLNYYSWITHIQKMQVYSGLLKRFLNNKGIPLIPPIFYGNKYLIDFKKKAELFNYFFAKQCLLIGKYVLW